MLWSYLHRIERRELYRRLISGIVPCVYVLLGVLAPEMGDEGRSEFSKQVAAILQSIIGQPPPEVLGLMGAAGVAGITSFYKANPLGAGKLGSPNP